MSTQENLAVIQNLYGAFGQGDMQTVFSLIHPEVDWHYVAQREDLPWGGKWHGRDAMVQFFTAVVEHTELAEFGPREMMAFDDKVLVLGHERGTMKGSGEPFESDWVHLFRIEDGQVAYVREFYDSASLVDAYRGVPVSQHT